MKQEARSENDLSECTAYYLKHIMSLCNVKAKQDLKTLLLNK